ncbi:hypothetical protein GYM67_02545 [Bifidobacterium asteroides]|uniref:hypothetical protein n=1 Tax=Bifidobacterium asteroides TaxID=1684 RepID=UPI001C69C21C|nr:hypothetical protein [Bifidobacterium asteroides]QYN60079.1 hypothetical protein GYM67_02545 [Bifidobacterium asteroides]
MPTPSIHAVTAESTRMAGTPAGNEQPGHDHKPHHKPAPFNPLRQRPPPSIPNPHQPRKKTNTPQQHPNQDKALTPATASRNTPQQQQDENKRKRIPHRITRTHPNHNTQPDLR